MPKPLAVCLKIVSAKCPTYVSIGRVGSYPTFSPLPRQFAHTNAPFIASDKGHTVCGISSPHQTRLRWALMGTPLGSKRYISVALVLGSPPAGVTCYPCPMEPGLSSPGRFHAPAAAVQPGRNPYCTLRGATCQISCKFFS